jgi:ABC-type spermidine/putrescine transport system permease subunit I
MQTRLKLFVILAFVICFGIAGFQSFISPVEAQKQTTFNELAGYKNWTKITKEPIKLEIDFASFAGG